MLQNYLCLLGKNPYSIVQLSEVLDLLMQEMLPGKLQTILWIWDYRTSIVSLTVHL